MKNLSTWLLVMFMVGFWAFRAVVALCAQLNWDFGGFTPLNLQMEIILLFVVIVCMVLVIKRKIVGGLIYLLAYGMYFGVDIYANVIQLIAPVTESAPELGVYTNLFVSVLGMFLAVAVLLDLLLDKGRKAHPKDKKTDWFYDNEKFDREVDERADRNNYRTL